MRMEKKDAELRQILYDLSEKVLTNEQLIEVSNHLETVYKGEYRHSYSSLFSTIEEISDSPEYSMENLLQNLEGLKSVSSKQKFSAKVKKSIYKFYDHVMLEVLRLIHYEQMERNMQAMKNHIATDKALIEQYSQELKTTKNQLDQAKKDLDKARKDTKNFQAEIIGIISIFSAITLAFSGGLSYLSSAISAVHNSPILKLVVMILICGFVLFNTIFILLYVVARIIDKDIFFRCNSNTCKGCTKAEKDKSCSFVTKIRKCLPYLFWVDLILILAIFTVAGAMIYRKSPYCPEWLK